MEHHLLVVFDPAPVAARPQIAESERAEASDVCHGFFAVASRGMMKTAVCCVLPAAAAVGSCCLDFLEQFVH